MAGKGFSMSKTRDPFSNKKVGSIISKENYETTFDYLHHEIEDLRDEFIEYEKNIVTHAKRTAESVFEIAQTLHTANKELANRGNGTFTAWCENLGLSREMTSIFMKRYNLFLETNKDKEKIMLLPVRALKALTKNDSDFSEEEKLRVIESKKPTAELEFVKQDRESLSNGLTNLSDILEAEIIETDQEVLTRLENEIDFLDRDIKEREKNLKRLKAKKEGLQIEREALLKVK